MAEENTKYVIYMTSFSFYSLPYVNQGVQIYGNAWWSPTLNAASSLGSQIKVVITNAIVFNQLARLVSPSTVFLITVLIAVTIWLEGRMFTNGPEGPGSIPGRVMLKTQKMILDTSSLNTQHYKYVSRAKWSN